MTTSGTNKEGVRFIVDVRIMENMKIFIHMRILSTKSPSLIKYERDRPVHVRSHTRSIRLQRLCREHHSEFPIRIQRGKDRRDRDRRYSSQTCILVLENPEILGMDVIEPYIFNKKFTV
ncbi:BetaC1 [Cotton leaf curl Multan betasatellite-[Pakistan:Multan:Co1222:08]]|uniref:BetaC1 n=1 Tax=Cotton leaf curl Multan betasatellite-[Pakistan:Multan:Co1222:08] TaxID=649193 RepID=C5ICF7_9VIRU|nr:BetaC1 [Cotton leaf curl Multan betasatellite-[Pakistan:Multan:Co1222:08]]